MAAPSRACIRSAHVLMAAPCRACIRSAHVLMAAPCRACIRSAHVLMAAPCRACIRSAHLLLLLDDLFQLCGHFRNLLSQYLHLTVSTPAHDNVRLAETLDLFRIVLAKMATAAFFSLDSGAGDRFGDDKEIPQIEGSVPAGVVFTITIDGHLACTLSKRFDFVERSHHFRLCSHDTDKVLHLFLQIVLNTIRTLACRRS